MKRYSVLCVLILGLMQLSNSLVAQQNTSDSLALDMQGSINLLLQQNPDIKVANQALMQNEYERKSARGLYMPQVGLSATFGIQNQPATLDLSPIGDALSGIYSLSAAQTQLIGNLHGITNTEAYTLLLNKLDVI
ncbi:MAG TPA: TolC family protein [Tenuifilaceae bacterium]|nr:TolC family protein [Tenuifilaceae bacterium]